jgi:hypothetical protein
MNLHDSQEQDDIVLTITYEYVLARHAKDFIKITPYWIDVGGCETSNVPAELDEVFEYSSPVVVAAEDGIVTFVAGHLHDGGTHISLVQDGNNAYTANATYKAYANVNDDGMTEHISSISACEMPGTSTAGDEWTITAYYDTKSHEPMALMDGSLEPVMGIMLAYIAHGAPQTILPRPKYWIVVLGLGVVAAVVLSVAHWLWFRERQAIRLKRGDTFNGESYRDSSIDEESSVPLMRP